jgi:hypothetical protein
VRHWAATTEEVPMEHEVTLLSRKFVTHDVQRFVLTRPDGFEFEPGQGVELAIDEPELVDDLEAILFDLGAAPDALVYER